MSRHFGQREEERNGGRDDFSIKEIWTFDGEIETHTILFFPHYTYFFSVL